MKHHVPYFRLGTLVVGVLFFYAIPVLAYEQDAVNDPSGDISVALGDVNSLDVGYADITSAWVRPAFNSPALELGVFLALPIPQDVTDDFDLIFSFDVDGEVANNALGGVSAGSDFAILLSYSAVLQTLKTNAASYDTTSGEWLAVDGPEISPGIYGDKLIMRVPEEYLSVDGCRHWRATISSTSQSETNLAVDSVPDGVADLLDSCGEGKPVVVSGLPKPELSQPATSSVLATEDELNGWKMALALAILIIGIVVAVIGSKEKRDFVAKTGE